MQRRAYGRKGLDAMHHTGAASFSFGPGLFLRLNSARLILPAAAHKEGAVLVERALLGRPRLLQRAHPQLQPNAPSRDAAHTFTVLSKVKIMLTADGESIRTSSKSARSPFSTSLDVSNSLKTRHSCDRLPTGWTLSFPVYWYYPRIFTLGLESPSTGPGQTLPPTQRVLSSLTLVDVPLAPC